jgi:uncharacterized membrane protein YqiK
MSHVFEFLSHYWWAIALVAGVILHKAIFRLFGIVIVPENKVGLVTKKFVLFGKNKNLPDGKIIATNGEAGLQGQTLSPGLHFWRWPWQYTIDMHGFTVIPEGKLGLILAKDGKELKTGRILARKIECDNFQDAISFLNNGGQKGRQAPYITAGTYRINTHLFDVSVVDQVHIGDDMVGVVAALDGEPLPSGQIAGLEFKGHNNFQDFDAFLDSGGFRGRQAQVILAGTYNLNPWAVDVEEIKMTEIPIGHVGVVMSYIGEDGVDVTGAGFKHGNLVTKGQKGVWSEPLGPGKYPINTYVMNVELVPTTNLVLNWASARTESHNLDAHLSTITVRSRDGFPFNLDVSQIIHISMSEAPKVIARFGSMINLVSQVLEPTIGNYFRNSAQDSDVISFLTSRKERQESAKQHISEVLDKYDVHAVDTLIGDITPPAELMKTLTDRKIAQEQEVTFDTQTKAQQKRQSYEKQLSIADMQSEIVKADQGVQIAERLADAAVKKATGEAESKKIAASADSASIEMRAKANATQTELLGKAEATATLAKGEANAQAYKLAVDAMGSDNFTQMKITESIGNNNIKVIPDVLITGGNGDGSNSAMTGLLGMKLMETMGKDMGNKHITPSTEVPTEGKGKKDNK